MNTDTLMSSLREMVKAEAQLQAMEMVPWHESQKEAVRLQYSRHETIVREQLAALGEKVG
jgi:hypothetical protein